MQAHVDPQIFLCEREFESIMTAQNLPRYLRSYGKVERHFEESSLVSRTPSRQSL